LTEIWDTGEIAKKTVTGNDDLRMEHVFAFAMDNEEPRGRRHSNVQQLTKGKLIGLFNRFCQE